MRGSKKDPQQYRAYRWENELTSWAGAHATPAQLRRVVKKCCRMYRVPVPRVHCLTKNQRDGKRYTSEYDPNGHVIRIRPRHYDLCTAVHESAHAITDWLFGIWTENKPHGPEWLGVYMVLLDRLKIIPRIALEAHARAMGLDFYAPQLIAPRQVRKRFRRRVKFANRERRMLRLWT